MITSLSNWRSGERLEPSYFNTMLNSPLGTTEIVGPPDPSTSTTLVPALAPLTGAPVIVSEADVSAVQFNPAMLPIIQEIMLIREKYRDTAKLIANLNQVPGLALLFRNVRVRGTPKTERLDKWKAAQIAVNASIDALFSWAKDLCVEFLTFLPGWLQSNLPSAIRSFGVNAVNKIIQALGGVDMTCAKFVDFVRDEVFNQYVFPFINDIIGAKVIDVGTTTESMYGTKFLEEKQIIANVLAELKKLNATIPAFTNPGGAGTPLPPLPPLPKAPTDFSADAVKGGQTEMSLSTTTKALIGGGVVLGVVSLVLVARSGGGSYRDDYDYRRDDYDYRRDDYDYRRDDYEDRKPRQHKDKKHKKSKVKS